MIEIYTANSCRSCTKAAKWLKDHHIPFINIKLEYAITEEGVLQKILSYTDLGFDSIIALRSKEYKKLKVDFSKLKLADAIDFISKNPSIISKPIIIDTINGNMQVGYNKSDIEIFELAANHDWKKCPLSPEACHYVLLKAEFKKFLEFNKKKD